MLYQLLLTVLFFFVILFQATFIPVFTDLFPNLFLIILLTLCWTGRGSKALWAAFIGGIFYDFLTVRPLGIRSLLLIVIVAGVLLIRRLTDNLLSRFLIAFFIALGWRIYPAFFLAERTVFLAALDALVFVIFLPIFSVLFGRILWEEDPQLSFKDKL